MAHKCGRAHTCQEIFDWQEAVHSVGDLLKAEKREVRRLRAALRSIATIREIADEGSTLDELGREAQKALRRPRVI